MRPEQSRIAVIFWPVTSPGPTLVHGPPSDKIASRIWLGPGVRFAVLGANKGPEFDKAADAVFQFYAEALGAT